MGRYKINDVTKVKDCEYARQFDVVGYAVKIIELDDEKDQYDYRVEFIDSCNKHGSTKDYFLDDELE